MTPTEAARVHRGRSLLAASLIVVDRSGREPLILMGRRRPDAVFLPDKFVFPGGRLEPGDGDIRPSGALGEHDHGCLLRGLRHADPQRGLSAFVTAAVRETYEETGYLVAVDDAHGGARELKERAVDWSTLVQAGVRPDLQQLRYVARAITPPGRPRRYDTRFFLADASSVQAKVLRTDGELSEIGWLPLARLSTYDLPSITRLVIADITTALDADRHDIPFYFWRAGAFQRAVLKGRTAGKGGAA